MKSNKFSVESREEKRFELLLPHRLLEDSADFQVFDKRIELTSFVGGQEHKDRFLNFGVAVRILMLYEVLDLLHCLDAVEARHHKVGEHMRDRFILAHQLRESHDGFLSIVNEFASVEKANLFKLLSDDLHVVQLVFSDDDFATQWVRKLVSFLAFRIGNFLILFLLFIFRFFYQLVAIKFVLL